MWVGLSLQSFLREIKNLRIINRAVEIDSHPLLQQMKCTSEAVG